jgi:hypothetical protein
MDPIEGNKNCVTTECGHAFHANCLMTSVAHNGFGCPYCRTVMAEVPNDDDDEDEYDEYDDEDEDEEVEDDDALRGLRFFMNNLTGQEHDEQDIEEEDVYIQYQDNTQPEESEPIPTASFIAQKLIQQGVTMEDLVKTLLLNHEEYEAQSEQLDRTDVEIFGKMRIIISNYTPENV